ncbi:autotransporter outer membrane beta-barrel domain-containing protein [Azoarcus sp. TTM-91]|uniref:autotransporter outer membrane beta-barrel domain-containing protein n=1 Tax=Azoarcus sp. TTM-91 TaxID=2691581 RepID=UPI001B7CE1CC|nr:autotransporter outer membrane beta-barrel domain-containing protein [Azoarcus sp. TTM-91]
MKRNNLPVTTSLLGLSLAVLAQHPAQAAPCGTINTAVFDTSGVACDGPAFVGSGLTSLAIAVSSTISGGSIGLQSSSSILDSLINDGVISASDRGLFNAGGSIGTLSNAGTLSASAAQSAGIHNVATIGLIHNQISGTIVGQYAGISNSGFIGDATSGTIGTIINAGLITGSGSGSLTSNGIVSSNGGYIGLIENQAGGTITSNSSGIFNYGGSTIGTVTNSGMISGPLYGIGNEATIISLENTGGTISGDQAGIWNSAQGHIDSIDNDGFIVSSSGIGISNSGSIGTLTNSGTLSAATAIQNDGAGSIGSVVNSGLIAGNIGNTSANALTIVGGSGGTIGTLTGVSGGTGSADKGTITSTTANVVFSDGALLLNDNIVATGHTIANTGAQLLLSNQVTMTGAYLQTTGSLQLDSSSAGLTVTGAANITGGEIELGGFSASANNLVNQGSVLAVSGGSGSTFTGLSYASDVEGLELAGSVTGNSLSLTGGNNYIGASLASLDNSGTLNAFNPVYVASTGSLGTLTNSGALIGTGAGVRNLGSIGTISNDGSIVGGTIGIYNYGSASSISELNSSGTIQGQLGIVNDGTIGLLHNQGLVTGSVNAIFSSGQLGTIRNAGVIAGNIVNTSTNALSITGGTISAPGTLTGYGGGIGTISSTAANVLFLGGGVQLLNSNINVGSNAVVNSGGVLMVNEAISITGNYTQSTGGLIVGVSSSSYGNLLVSGNASLTGGFVNMQALGGGSVQEGTYTIVSAGSGLSLGNLSYYASGYVVTGSLVTVGGNTQLVLTVGDGGGVPTTEYTRIGQQQGGFATGMGVALDRIAAIASSSGVTPAAAAFQSDVLAPLGALSEGEQQVGVAQLAPNQLTPQLISTAVKPVAMAIGQHQEMIAGVMNGSDRNAVAQMAGLTGQSSGDGLLGQRGAFWGELVGGVADRDNSRKAAGYRASSAGFVIGADWYASPSFMAGLAFSWIRNDLDGRGVSSGSKTQADTYQVTAYSLWLPDWADGRLSIAGQLGIGVNRYDQSRRIDFLGVKAKADYDGEQYLGQVTVGYDFPLNQNLTLTPQFSLMAARLENDGYTEHGAGAANLKVDHLSTDVLTQELGVKLSASFDTAAGRLAPDVKVAWLHEYEDGAIRTSGAMGGVAFTSSSTRLSADGVTVGVGATLDKKNGVKLRLEYNGDFRHAYQAHTGVLRASWDF